MTSHKRRSGFYHQQLYCLFGSLLRLTSTETPKITCPVYEESTSERWIPLTKDQLCEKFSMSWPHYNAMHNYFKMRRLGTQRHVLIFLTSSLSIVLWVRQNSSLDLIYARHMSTMCCQYTKTLTRILLIQIMIGPRHQGQIYHEQAK